MHYEEFEEKTYSECSGDIKIMSILNLDSDHMWPEAGYNKDTGVSSYTNFGSCVEDIQSDLNAPKCYRSNDCLLYTSPSPRDLSTSRMPSSA